MRVTLPFEDEKREIIVKKESISNKEFGKEPDKRSIKELLEKGIVNIDKPSGPTSHQVSAYVKEMLSIEKAGHSGTLDPAVTGCLPITLSKGTKIVQALIGCGKEYVCVMHLHDDKTEDEIKTVANEFIGKIQQMPPVKSAVKRQLRTREIYYLEIIEIDGRDVLFKVGCEAGTYIRKLCTDMGHKLGCGAHMAELRRSKAGPFHIDNSITLTDLMDAYKFYEEDASEDELRKYVKPIETAIEHLGRIYVFDQTIDSLCHGAPLNIPGISKLESGIEKGNIVAIMSLKGELIGIGNSELSSEEIANNNRGCVLKKMKTFMEIGIYPSFKKDNKKEESK